MMTFPTKRGWSDRDKLVGAVVVLIVMIVAAFSPLLNNGFVEFDDQIYITRNPEVLHGLTWGGLRWAFITTHAGNWHPLAWISHMADVTVFGIDPRGHHLINLLLHLGSSVLLFLTLRGMTGKASPSFFVTAFFALHPLRVESVAWAAERKDVLSVFFWMLAMAAYAAYARSRSLRSYLATVAAFVLGLLAKPMLVTLPFAMLLLDYWPLGRLRVNYPASSGGSSRLSSTPLRLLYEKAPFLALAALSSVVTYLAQRAEGYTRTFELYPFTTRLNNAIVSYLTYFRQLVWPEGLAIFYPHPRNTLPLWAGIVAAVFLAVVTILLIRASAKKPYLVTGWLWYLGTLVPVIGLVQVGGQATADRYTYLPHIGVFIMVCWLTADISRRQLRLAGVFGIAGVLVVLILSRLTQLQTGTWRDTITLFSHAAKVTRDNWQAHLVLWAAFNKAGKNAEAQFHYSEIMRIRPEFAATHATQGLGIPGLANGQAGPGHTMPDAEATPESLELFRQGQDLIEQGRLKEAAAQIASSLERSPDFIAARFTLGDVLSRMGATQEAAAQYRDLLRRRPDHVAARINLAFELFRQGNIADAETQIKEALRLDDSDVEAHYNLGHLFFASNRKTEAAQEYRAVLRLDPKHVPALVGLADSLADTGQTVEAISFYRKILELDPWHEKARRKLRALGAAAK